jgi:acyl-[acyl-carrier-protein]-phospholipid O-acyltransferase/long-chain-fatty-acid--[acyl-carrier-protein] ligase
MANSRLPAAGEPQLGLRSAGFVGLATLQFLTALNDNAFRWLVVPVGYVLLGPENKGLVLSLGLACFVTPYILLLSPASYLADRFSKQRILAVTMLLQALIVALGMGAILLSHAVLMFSSLVLMGVQGALLGPAKSGAIPEMMRSDSISAANGVMGMASVMAAVVGTTLGNTLYVLTAPLGIHHWWISGATMVGISLAGWGASLLIVPCREADPERPPPRHPLKDAIRDLDSLRPDSRLLAVAAASAFLWFLAALAQVSVYLLGTTTLHIEQEEVGFLLALLAAGAATGSVTAGIWSSGRVELGLVPIGAGGITITSFMMYVVTLGPNPSFGWSAFYLFMIGFASGLYEVPLSSYLQHYSPERSRGRVLAAANALAFTAMLLASGMFWVLRSLLGESAGEIFLVASLLSLGVFTAAAIVQGRRALVVLMKPLRWLGQRLGR